MKTQDDVAAMLRLKALGWGKKRIAVELCCSPKTVCHWLTLGEWHPYGSRSSPGKLDGLSDWLRERFRLHAGNTNAVRQELAREKNITVSLRTVERAVAPLWREFFLVERARQAAFEWMRSVLQKDISLDVLRGEIGDVSEVETLLRRLYEGRLSDRNRSMVVLANRRGVKTRFVCGFLGIDRTTHRKYLRSFKDGGCDALFTCQIKVTRKFDDETVKQAVFGLLHEPPSNHGINRTTWIMSDLTRVLRETGHPACPDVIRKITKVAGYRWRKARIALTSADPNYNEKLDNIRSISSAQCAAMVEDAVSRWGRLDCLDNNVGIGSKGTVVEETEDNWARVMHVNVDTMFLTCKHAIPAMIRTAGGGAIVNVSSISALRPRGLTAYTVSKGAVIALTKAIAVDHGADGIRVNCVAPGPVYTPMVYARSMTEQARDTRRPASVLKREGTGWISVAPCASCCPTKPVTSPARSWSWTVGLRLSARAGHRNKLDHGKQTRTARP